MLSMVVGGFYGDEGKGKIIGYLSKDEEVRIAAKVGGGPQAGHTVEEGKSVCQIPSAFINSDVRLLIGRGTVINPEIVLEEIEKYDVGDRLGIDYGCTVIEQNHIDREKGDLVGRIGSVGTGTGPARVDRLLRKSKTAEDVKSLEPYLTNVSKEISDALKSDIRVLVEGVQGYGLNLMNYKYYPYVTSQVTTASQFCSDLGIGPKAVDEIYVVFKAYVSRVGKGPMNYQWSEEECKRHGIEERGTVSGRPRRLGDFDKDMARDALVENTGTQVAITCIDRLFEGNYGVKEFDKLTEEAQYFINDISLSLKESSQYFKGVSLISTGPNSEHTIDLR